MQGGGAAQRYPLDPLDEFCGIKMQPALGVYLRHS